MKAKTKTPKIMAFILVGIMLATQLFGGGVLLLNVSADDPVATGTFRNLADDGDLTWALYDDGTLTITGTGAMPNTTSHPWRAHMTNTTTVEIGNGVTFIGDYAFASYSALESVTIGNGVTTIGTGAFISCGKLTSVTFEENSQLTTIGEYAFESCTSLTSVTLPNNLETIGIRAFFLSGLTSIVIPNSVTDIGNLAFANCTSLTSVTIGNGVTSIGNYAFQWCTGLTDVTINGAASIGYNAFDGCTNLKTVNMPNVTSIDNNAFQATGLTTIIIPDSVVTIGRAAFVNCENLTSVTIGSGVESIGDIAFAQCTKLTSVVIGKNVGTIYNTAFQDCTKLEYIYFTGDEPPEVTPQDSVLILSNPNGTKVIVPSTWDPENIDKLPDTGVTIAVNDPDIIKMPPTISVEIGSTVELRAEIDTDEDYTAIEWASLNTNVAAVTRSANPATISGVNVGTAVIAVTVTVDDGTDMTYAATCTVTVTPPTPLVPDELDPDPNLDPQPEPPPQYPPFFPQYIPPYIPPSTQSTQQSTPATSDSGGYTPPAQPTVSGNSLNLPFELTPTGGYVITANVAALRRIADSDDDLTITIPSSLIGSVGVTEIVLDNAALKAIVATAGRNGTISITVDTVPQSKLTRAERRQVGDNPVYEVVIFAERKGERVADLKGGEVTLTLRRNATMGDSDSERSIFYRNAEGDIKRSDAGEYSRRKNGVNNVITFTFDDM